MNRSSRFALLAIAGALLAADPAAASGPAPTWQPAVTVRAPAGESGTPQVALNARGDAAAVWSETVNGKAVVRSAARVAGHGWTPSKYPTGPVTDTPRTGIDDSGQVYSLWAAPVNQKQPLWFAVTAPGGASVVSKLSDLGAAPSLAVNGHGDAVAAWITRGSNGYLIVAAFKPAGGSFGSPHALTPDLAGGPLQLDAAIDSHGNALVAWNAAGAIAASARPVAGDWGSAEALSSPKEIGYSPHAALDGANGATVVWQSNSQKYGYDVIEGAEGSVAGGFAKLQEIAVEGESTVPALAVDASGRAVLTFLRDNGGHEVVQASTRPAPGAAWSTPASLSRPDKQSDAPAVAVDGAGNALVVWDQKAVVGNLAYGSSLRAGGSWSSPHALGGPASGPTSPQVAFDGAGDAVAAFTNGFPIETADYDAAPSLAGVQVPASALVGDTVATEASGADLWSPVGIAWDFGDGSSAAGSQVSHSYAAVGDYTVTVTATDGAGNASSEQRTIHVIAPDGGGAPPSPPTQQQTGFRGLRIKRQTIVVRHGGARVRVSCPAGTVGACAGTLQPRGHKLVGHTHFKVRAGKHARIRVGVAGVGSVRATARAHDGAGAKRTTRTRLRLVSPHGPARHGRR
jgi:hypothetical protein